jgi:RNA polymerase sigma-B factor
MPAVNHAADEELQRRYRERDDSDARRELVDRFLPFARDLARRYSHTDEPLEDLVQVASLGLLKAIDRYEPERGTRFTSYATPTILGELRRYFRDNGWSLHVPRELKERALDAKQAVDTLSARLGRSPTTREAAAALGCTSEEVLEALDAAASYRPVSLDATIEGDSRGADRLADSLGSEDRGYELVEEREAIARMWEALPELEQKVIQLRFFHELTQQAIGERLGYSQMHISRLVRRALARLEETAASRGAA